MNDEFVEKLWDNMEDVPFDENDAGEMILAEPYWIWKIGTCRDDIWHWFDETHSKGVAYLLYGGEG